jgi:hypothetical protein
MTEDELLTRFGLRPAWRELDEVRRILTEEASKEESAQGTGDTDAMKLCAAMLFLVGEIKDALLIWRAKCSSFDARCSIDDELLCIGADASAVLRFFSTPEMDTEARALAEHLEMRIKGGDFDEDLATYAAFLDNNYAVDEVRDLLERLENTPRFNDPRRQRQLVFRCCELLGDRIPRAGKEALDLARAYERGDVTVEEVTVARAEIWRILDGTRSEDPTLRIVMCALFPDDAKRNGFDHAYYVLEWAESLGVTKPIQRRLLEETFVEG